MNIAPPPASPPPPEQPLPELTALGLADAVWLASRMGSTAVPPPAASALRGESSTYLLSRADDVPTLVRQDPAPGTGPDRTDVPAQGDDSLTPVGASSALQRAAPGATGQASARIGALRTLTGLRAFHAGFTAFRSQPRGRASQIDEVATAEEYAVRSGVLAVLALQRQSRRWLRLSLLTEATATNSLWSQPMDEFEAIARKHGAFRQIRRWSLQGGMAPELVPVGVYGALGRRHQQPGKFAWGKDEIIIILSDYCSQDWWYGSFPALIRRWSATQPLLLMHTLPERLWNRSWVGAADGVVYAPTPACAGAALRMSSMEGETAPSGLTAPLAALNAASFSRWSNSLMSTAKRGTPAIFLDLRRPLERHGDSIAALSQAPLPDAQTMIMTYTMSSSSLARQLAKYMALTAPLTFPVMRWVQQALLPQSDDSHLAEFVLGGLLQQVPGDPTGAADDVMYDFVDGLRERLQHGIPVTHAVEVLQTVGAFLEANQGNTVDARTGIVTYPNIDALSPSVRAFALVSRHFLARYGLSAQGTTIAQEPPQKSYIQKPPSTRKENTKAPVPAATTAPRGTISRRLRHGIIDVKWSTASDGRLAILHEGGVELWDTLHERRGTDITLAASRESGGAAPPALHIYWYADGPAARGASRSSVSARSVIARIAIALRTQCGRKVVLKQIRTLNELAALSRDTGKPDGFVVFENGGPVSFVATLQMTWKAVLGVIRLDSRAQHHPRLELQLDLSSYNTDHIDSAARRGLTMRIGGFARKMRSLMYDNERTTGAAHNAATAICWIDDNTLAIAERRGPGWIINELNVLALSSGAQVSALSVAAFDGTYGFVVQMVCLPEQRARDAYLVTGSESTTETARSGDAPLAWIDNDGALYIQGRIRAAGNGYPRTLTGAGDQRVAVSSHGLGLKFVSSEYDGESIPLNLLPGVERERGKPVPAQFYEEKIVRAAINGALACAVTDAGWLHEGEVPDRDPHFSASGVLDRTPLNLGGKVLVAAFSADGCTLCVWKERGVLELWNTSTRVCTDRLAHNRKRRQHHQLAVEFSPDMDSVVVADGTSLEIFPLTVGHDGAVFNITKEDAGSHHVLWVDDNPDKQAYERKLFSDRGMTFSLAATTDEALGLLRRYRYGAIISDMGRLEGPREGYVLLDALRAGQDWTPLFFYTGSNTLAHKQEAKAHGAQGSTNNVHDLVKMLTSVLPPSRKGD